MECAEKIEEIGDFLSINEKESVCVICKKKGREVRVAKCY